MRRLGCWLLAAGLVVLGCLAASRCGSGEADARLSNSLRDRCVTEGGIPRWRGPSGFYGGCDFPPQPCGPLPAEAGP